MKSSMYNARKIAQSPNIVMSSQQSQQFAAPNPLAFGHEIVYGGNMQPYMLEDLEMQQQQQQQLYQWLTYQQQQQAVQQQQQQQQKRQPTAKKPASRAAKTMTATTRQNPATKLSKSTKYAQSQPQRQQQRQQQQQQQQQQHMMQQSYHQMLPPSLPYAYFAPTAAGAGVPTAGMSAAAASGLLMPPQSLAPKHTFNYGYMPTRCDPNAWQGYAMMPTNVNQPYAFGLSPLD